MSTSTTSTAVATTAIKILSSTIRSTGTAVSTATSKALSSESLSKAATTTTAKVASVAKAVSSSTPGPYTPCPECRRFTDTPQGH